jgi:phage/plasmid-associated DNA primase
MTVEQIREFYIRQSDSVGAFVLDEVEVSPEGVITKKKLLAAYQEYCRKKKYPPVAQERFFKKFPEKVRVEEDRRRVEGVPERCYAGIKLIVEEKTELEQAVL